MSGSFFPRARRQDFFVAFVLGAIRALPAPECDNHKAPLCHCTLALSLGTDNAWEDHHASWCQGFLSPFGLLSIGQQRGTGHGWGPQPRASETQWIILFFFFHLYWIILLPGELRAALSWAFLRLCPGFREGDSPSCHVFWLSAFND